MITNNDIREYLGFEKVDDEFEITQVDALGLNDNTLMFINKPVDFGVFNLSKNCLYLIEEGLESYGLMSTSSDFLYVKNVKYRFYCVVKAFNLRSRLQKEYLYSGMTNRTDVHCRECEIGPNCKIDPHVIIGGEDFSPVLTDGDSLVQFPQMGGVKIGQGVTIKYNTMIGKGTFGYTRVGDNTMIDYGCQIGHNCDIGKRCIIAAGTIIGGSTIVGNDTVIGMGATIRNGIRIGNNVSIGMGSVVIRDVPDNTVVVGNPAKVIEHKKIFDEKGLV